MRITIAAVAGSAVAVGVATALLVSSGSTPAPAQTMAYAQMAKACREMVLWATPGGTNRDAVNAELDAQGSTLAVDFQRWVSDAAGLSGNVATDSQEVQQDCAAYGVPASAWMTGY
jgi:hypothetical protein